MKTALVTGATGFVGNHLSRRLAESGWHVHALTRSVSPRGIVGERAANIHFHSLADQSVEQIVDRIAAVDVVFHLATNYGRKGVSASEVVNANVMFPLRLLESALQKNVSLFVATDTCFTVDYPYLRPYTLSKKQFAQWGKTLAEDSSLRFLNLVLQHPYGPGDRADKFVSWVMQQCLDNVATIDLTPGVQAKDFVYVSDVIDAYIALAVRYREIPAGVTDVSCGSGVATPVRDFVSLIHELSESTSELRFGALPQREGEIMTSCASNDQLEKLGWRPATSLRQGVQLTLESMRQSER